MTEEMQRPGPESGASSILPVTPFSVISGATFCKASVIKMMVASFFVSVAVSASLRYLSIPSLSPCPMAVLPPGDVVPTTVFTGSQLVVPSVPRLTKMTTGGLAGSLSRSATVALVEKKTTARRSCVASAEKEPPTLSGPPSSACVQRSTNCWMVSFNMFHLEGEPAGAPSGAENILPDLSKTSTTPSGRRPLTFAGSSAAPEGGGPTLAALLFILLLGKSHGPFSSTPAVRSRSLGTVYVFIR